jgi:hypothetical protein
VVGVIDAKTAQWLQNVPDTGGANRPLPKKNRIFTIVAASATARTACTPFGYQTTGCITVFGHEGKEHGDDGDDHDGDDDD